MIRKRTCCRKNEICRALSFKGRCRRRLIKFVGLLIVKLSLWMLEHHEKTSPRIPQNSAIVLLKNSVPVPRTGEDVIRCLERNTNLPFHIKKKFNRRFIFKPRVWWPSKWEQFIHSRICSNYFPVPPRKSSGFVYFSHKTISNSTSWYVILNKPSILDTTPHKVHYDNVSKVPPPIPFLFQENRSIRNPPCP